MTDDLRDEPTTDQNSPAFVPLLGEPVPHDLPARRRPTPMNPWTASPTADLGDASAFDGHGDGRTATVTSIRNGRRTQSGTNGHALSGLDGNGALDPAGVIHRGPPVDWTLVSDLQETASKQISEAVAANQTMTGQAQQALGRSIVQDLVEQAATDRIDNDRDPLTLTQQETLARAVFDALFRLGRLQPLVDADRVEDIMINGCDDVSLRLVDGTEMPGPPVAESDQELIDFLIHLASRSEVNARPFSEAHPYLDLRLDGGARMAASAWVTPRPAVVIRRHRLMRVTLDDLVARKMLTPLAASFLAAAVRGRRSIVVSGAAGAGKTTLVRALCAEIPEGEWIGTFETEYELHLHQLRRRIYAWEERVGSGERRPDGSMAGESTIAEALYRSLRYSLSRQIVGEVRGSEALWMIRAMENGTGSLSTTHATSAVGAIRKLASCAMEAGPHVTHTLATAKLASTLDLIVHLDLEYGQAADDAPRRRVAEIVAVEPGEHDAGYATTHVFRWGPEAVAVPDHIPDEYRDLARFGFDLTEFTAQQGART